MLSPCPPSRHATLAAGAAVGPSGSCSIPLPDPFSASFPPLNHHLFRLTRAGAVFKLQVFILGGETRLPAGCMAPSPPLVRRRHVPGGCLALSQLLSGSRRSGVGAAATRQPLPPSPHQQMGAWGTWGHVVGGMCLTDTSPAPAPLRKPPGFGVYRPEGCRKR